jgi:hypothetical protein
MMIAPSMMIAAMSGIHHFCDQLSRWRWTKALSGAQLRYSL